MIVDQDSLGTVPEDAFLVQLECTNRPPVLILVLLALNSLPQVSPGRARCSPVDATPVTPAVMEAYAAPARLDLTNQPLESELA